MSTILHVVVEVRAVDRGTAAEIDLPGFEVDEGHAHPLALQGDTDDEDRVAVRGSVDRADLDQLRRDPRVSDVYLDTTALPKPGLLRFVQDSTSDAVEGDPK